MRTVIRLRVSGLDKVHTCAVHSLNSHLDRADKVVQLLVDLLRPCQQIVRKLAQVQRKLSAAQHIAHTPAMHVV